MSKKQPKTEETIDERLYRELGVIPVSQDHPIYSRGPSIRFISKKNKRERNDAVRRGVRRKRTELTRAPGAVCVAYNAPSTVHFS